MIHATRRQAICTAVLVLATMAAGAAHASSSGLDTPAGIHDLPLSVEGASIIDLNDSTTPPTAMVNGDLAATGGLRAGSSSNVTRCGPGQAEGEGNQRYNYTAHEMEYCNGTSWVTSGQNNQSVSYVVNLGSTNQDLGWHTFCALAGGFGEPWGDQINVWASEFNGTQSHWFAQNYCTNSDYWDPTVTVNCLN